MNILDIEIVRVALAVVISWALFAVLISLAQEAIAQIIAERGRFMRYYLTKQLWDAGNKINWATLLYQHGSIDLLSRAASKPTNDIQPKLFAETLIDVVGKSHVAGMVVQKNAFVNDTLQKFKNATMTLQQSDVVMMLQTSMKSAELKASTNASVSEGLIYDHLVKEVSAWYTEFTQRLSLWYKKRMRQRLFIIGLIAALLLNVDSIQLFNFFKISPDAVSAVHRYYQNYSDSTKVTNDSAITKFVAYKNSLDSLVKSAEMPVGFDFSVFKQHPNQKGWVFWKILGLIITGLAVSFGAPFWFQVMEKAYSTKKIAVNAVL